MLQLFKNRRRRPQLWEIIILTTMYIFVLSWIWVMLVDHHQEIIVNDGYVHFTSI